MNKVLVTGIGGNVGYGIIRNIRHAYPDICIVGTNTARISAGNHQCDEVFEVPFSTDHSYIPAIKKICDQYCIDLIIPSTDYEVYVLAANKEILPVVAASPAGTAKIFLDKYMSFTELKSFDIPFAESILPSLYDGRFDKYILKPREGRGSRNLFLNPENPETFSDEYIVQPLLTGKEITTAFYVTKTNKLHGLITMDRELSAGATNICEVITDFDKELGAYLLNLIDKIEIRGACNIQSIVTNDGFVPFEINCRISGTNSIRSQFGFKDVSYTVDEYLFNIDPEPTDVKKGTAVRILHDIIYLGIKRSEVNNKTDNFYVYE